MNAQWMSNIIIIIHDWFSLRNYPPTNLTRISSGWWWLTGIMTGAYLLHTKSGEEFGTHRLVHMLNFDYQT